MITIGAYSKGSNPRVDLAIEKHPKLMELLRQPVSELSSREASFAKLAAVVS